MKPEQIGQSSFNIIDQEAGSHNFPPEQWTTADFEYQHMVRFHPVAIKAGIGAIKAGKTIITDTNMARVGIRDKELEPFGVSVKCFIKDSAVQEIARKNDSTRAEAAVDAAVTEMNGGIYVVGNAPTALMRLIELVANKQAHPALIIGLPVGFVNAAESKAALVELDYPYISNVGRKGGSNVAASVMNALAKLAIKEY
jgi:precorrin-8X/cobalt-precorrin-8 methylmutase